MFVLQAENRNTQKKPKQLRREGIIPGVLFGKNLDASLSVQFSKKDITTLLKTHSIGSTVNVALGKDKYPTLLREISYAPGTTEIEHFNFQVLVRGEPVNSTASIVLLNRELVTGILQQPISEISYRALPADLIEKIEVDLTGLKAGDMIRISDLPVYKDSALEIQTPADGVVVLVTEKRSAAVAEEAEGEEDGEAASE